MASPGGSTTVERIVSEGVLQAARIILEARFPTVARPVEPQQHRPWFNIEVQEVEGGAKALERWRREGPSLPLVLEVFLQPWGTQAAGQDRVAVETLLERWVVHYYPTLPEGPSHLSRSHLSRLNPQSVYKRLVITLRSLYTYLRVLPAYRMYRACKRQRGATFTLGYRLHSTLPGASAATAPGARRMQTFSFGSVETPYGQLRISVAYQPASTVTILEQTTSPPPLPQIIADYVGGGGHSGHSSGGRGGHSSSGAGAGDGTRALRHAMSASAVGAGALPAALPSPSPPQVGGLGAAAGSPQVPGSLGRTAGGLPIRRSWSTSMRGASPQRTLSQPQGEPPSPTLPHDTPYGSAPQAVSLPAMLRTLSTSAGKYTVGSPAGRPPLAKPPRGPAAAAGPLPVPAARHPPSGSSPGSSSRGGHGFTSSSAAAEAFGSAAGEADEEADPDMAASPDGSSGSAPRQISAPMCIPGRGEEMCGPAGRGRRLRSSSDLWAMQHAAALHKPLSAPAVSHMPPPAAAGGRAGGSGGGRGASADAAAAGVAGGRGRRAGSNPSTDASPSPPPARLPAIPGTLGCESSGSTTSSLYPTSCSPQLPFAFTPSAQSLASFGARIGAGMMQGLERISPRLARTPSGTAGGSSVPHQAAAGMQLRGMASTAGGGGGAGGSAAGGSAAAAAAGTSGGSSAGFSPSSGGSSGGGVVGREVPASTALMRRPSWSSRSSAFSPLAGEASQPGVGYSVSPMQDAALDSLLGGSTPRHYSLATGGLPSPLASAGLGLPAGGGTHGRPGGSGGTLALLTYPSVSPEISGALDEADVLPFALDEGGASPYKTRSHAHPASPPLAPPQADSLPISTAAAAASLAGPLEPAASQAAAAPPAAHALGPTALPAAAAAAASSSAPAVDPDAAVGAFVRLIQEAPPLRLHANRAALTRAGSADLASLRGPAPGTSSGSDSSGATCLSDGRGLTLQAGLRQFLALRERLQQRGVVVGPCP